MDDKPTKSGWRWVRRIALVLLIMILLPIIGGLIYLKSLPMPSREKLDAADRRYREVRALFPKTDLRANSTTTTLTADPNSTAALQAECDRLYLKIFEDNLGLGGWDVLAHGADKQKMRAHLDDAKALAAFYDKGIRLSPEFRVKFKLKYASVLNGFAWMLTDEPFILSPDLKRKLEQKRSEDRLPQEMIDDHYNKMVLALKFLRVVDCPSSGFPDRGGLIHDDLSRIKNNALQPLTPELMKLELNLLAPREPMDWESYVAMDLDYYHELRFAGQELLDSRNSFQYAKFALSTQMPNSKWYKPIYTNGAALYGAIVGPPLHIAPMVNTRIAEEQQLQDYAAGCAHHSIPNEIPTFVALELKSNNEQIESRLLAGSIELRRGAEIPTPDRIGPDSYFFDPITQRPYRLYISQDNPNYVHLHIRRPVINGNQHTEMEVMAFYLPVNQAGLSAIPKLPKQ